jgi:hypothetical protein
MAGPDRTGDSFSRVDAGRLEGRHASGTALCRNADPPPDFYAAGPETSSGPAPIFYGRGMPAADSVALRRAAAALSAGPR